MQLKVIRCNTVTSKLLNLQVKVSQPGAIDVLDWFILCHGALTVLCFVGCLAASLASAFWVPVAFPPLPSSYDRSVCLQTLPDVFWGGGKFVISKGPLLQISFMIFSLIQPTFTKHFHYSKYIFVLRLTGRMYVKYAHALGSTDIRSFLTKFSQKYIRTLQVQFFYSYGKYQVES